MARILDLEPGHYTFKLSLQTATTGGWAYLPGGKVSPLLFERQIGQIDYRNFAGNGTMAMWTDDYKPAGNSN